jgi:hypothetical protein
MFRHDNQVVRNVANEQTGETSTENKNCLETIFTHGSAFEVGLQRVYERLAAGQYRMDKILRYLLWGFASCCA